MGSLMVKISFLVEDKIQTCNLLFSVVDSPINRTPTSEGFQAGPLPLGQPPHHQYINENAIQIVQSARDPPNHGVGLNPVGGGRGRGRGQ
ncbi:predicted protein [Coccidioides posadasii str. Silveira]|uniref:Predicted protein n=1 Tax=Coccidioides posadasii (strain RMSCC 757 / Silveira) TaxID=443226 RepID=E9CXJ6_COCPS|nr:predicted protein [Coccidioides posadasii str. Silveira]